MATDQGNQLDLESMDLRTLKALDTTGFSMHQKTRWFGYIGMLEREEKEAEHRARFSAAARHHDPAPRMTRTSSVQDLGPGRNPDDQDRVVHVRIIDGPENMVTRRSKAIGKEAKMAFVGDGQTLEAAIDEAVGLATPGNDVVVWSGNRVAAVVANDDLGRPRVEVFIDPTSA